MKKAFYIDTCIWLNLFKKEGDPAKGIPYWKIAYDFIEKVMFSNDKEIVYSGFVLKEIGFNLDDKTYKKTEQFFKRFEFVKAKSEDYSLARKLESNCNYEVSFFDCMHTTICKRLKLVMITRDNKLIRFAKKHIFVKRPEELII